MGERSKLARAQPRSSENSSQVTVGHPAARDALELIDSRSNLRAPKSISVPEVSAKHGRGPRSKRPDLPACATRSDLVEPRVHGYDFARAVPVIPAQFSPHRRFRARRHSGVLLPSRHYLLVGLRILVVLRDPGWRESVGGGPGASFRRLLASGKSRRYQGSRAGVQTRWLWVSELPHCASATRDRRRG